MSRFIRRDRHGRLASDPDVVEDPVVRQYRFLLRTAPPDALEAAHTESLPRLQDADRAAVLAAIQTGLMTGHRLTPEAVPRIGNLVVNGEHRDPAGGASTVNRVVTTPASSAVRVVDSGATVVAEAASSRRAARRSS